MAEATITIIGNLTRDPELKFLDGGSAAARFAVAVTKKWKDKGGNDKEQTSFFDCSALGQIAENIANALRKGDRVIVTGQLEQRSWDDKDGNKRSTCEVRVEGIGADLRFVKDSRPKSYVAPQEEEYSF